MAPLTESLAKHGGCSAGKDSKPTHLIFDCKQSGEGGEQAPSLRALGHDKSHANAGGQLAVAYSFDWQKGNDIDNPRPSTMNPQEGKTPTLSNTRTPAVAYQCHGSNVGEMGHLRAGNQNVTGGVPFVPVADTLRPHDGGCNEPGRLGAVIKHPMAVRRLTPRECERLQGFPDDYTKIPCRGKPASKCPDGPRYRALGNSMAVPVMRWLGRRIAEVKVNT